MHALSRHPLSKANPSLAKPRCELGMRSLCLEHGKKEDNRYCYAELFRFSFGKFCFAPTVHLDFNSTSLFALDFEYLIHYISFDLRFQYAKEIKMAEM